MVSEKCIILRFTILVLWPDFSHKIWSQPQGDFVWLEKNTFVQHTSYSYFCLFCR